MTNFPLWIAFAAAATFTVEAAGATVPFGPGERTSMEVRYLGLHVGEFDIRVSDEASTKTRALWPITFVARSRGLFDTLYSVRQHFVSTFDPELGRSLSSVERSDTGSWKTDTSMRFVGERLLVERTINGDTSQRVLDVAPGTQDILSAVFHLRTLDLKPDAHYAVPVFAGKKNWTLEARVGGREQVKTKAGTFDAWVVHCKTHLEGKLSTDRDITLWFSADERRLLLRVEGDVAVGALKVNLVAYEPPSPSPAPQANAKRP